MTTSGSTDFTSTEAEIIKDAFIKLNVYGAAETIAPEDYELARRLLNRIVKKWQTQDYHLWTKETAIIFLQKDQRTYELYSTGDHATIIYDEGTLSTDYSAGATTFVFDAAITASADDNIGIELDDNSLYWSTVKTVISTTSVEINGSLPSAASSGLKVYIYTTKLDEPFNIYSAVREDESEIDIPMNSLSYEEYFILPNKTNTGIPVSYNYNRQLGKAIISVWPVPENVENLMKITFARKIQDFDSNSNTPDFPVEWYEALVDNLAVKLAPAFGKTGSQSYQVLKIDATESLEAALIFDNENGSIFFQPRQS